MARQAGLNYNDSKLLLNSRLYLFQSEMAHERFFFVGKPIQSTKVRTMRALRMSAMCGPQDTRRAFLIVAANSRRKTLHARRLISRWLVGRSSGVACGPKLPPMANGRGSSFETT
jgi:hypothetical protein